MPSTLECSYHLQSTAARTLPICPDISKPPTSSHAEPHEGPTSHLLLPQAKLRSLVDVLACANFGPVLFVTLSYYTMRLLPIQEPIYGDDYRFQVLPAGVNPLEDGVRLGRPACHACPSLPYVLLLAQGMLLGSALWRTTCRRPRHMCPSLEFSKGAS